MERSLAAIVTIALLASPIPCIAHPRVERTQPAVQRPSLPLSFEERDAAKLYIARTGNAEVAIRPGSVDVAGAVRFELAGANSTARLSGTGRLPGVANYLVGRDRSKWRTNVPTFGGVRASGVWRGIDATYRGEDGHVVWDFHVSPHTDPHAIEVTVAGATSLEIDPTGSLVAHSATGDIRQDAPVVYQESGEGRVPVDGRFELRGPNRYGFRVGAYDRERPLTIDPTVRYAFAVGGNATTNAFGVAMDAQGNTYLVGTTLASNLPVVGGVDGSLGGFNDAFVAKVNASGTALVYSTYLGGSHNDYGSAIAIDSSGAAYVTGTTSLDATDDFPVTQGAFQTTYGGNGDAYLAKLSPDGATLVYATYLGGPSYDGGVSIGVDGVGNAYVTGGASSGFPTSNAIQPSAGGSSDAFVAKLNATGSALVYSTFLGGSDYEYGFGIAVSSAGAAFVTGTTLSTNFPTVRPVQASNGGEVDTFVTMLNPSGSALGFSTYLGGTGNDLVAGIAVDSAGSAYVTGTTYSADFPLVNAFQTTSCGAGDHLCPDAFVAKIDPANPSLVYSTYLGGNDYEAPAAIAVDASGSAYIVGATSSTDFPVVDPPAIARGQGIDVFVSRVLPSGSALDFSAVFGGSIGDFGAAIAVDPEGSSAAIAYSSGSTDFPGAGGSSRGPAPPIDVGGVLVFDFARRKMADVSANPLVFLSEQPDGSVNVKVIALFGNDGPDAAEDVRLEVNLPCASFVSYLASDRVLMTNLPEPGMESLGISGIITGPFQREEEAFIGVQATISAEDLSCLSANNVKARAEISSSAVDPHPSNNSRTTSVFFIPASAAPVLTWTSGPAAPDPPFDLQLSVPSGGSRSGLLSTPSLASVPLHKSVAAAAGVAGFKVYASQQPNVQAVPGNLFTTTPPAQTSADVSGAPAGSYFVVAAVYDNGQESVPSNEVGGTLPTITSVVVTAKKITALGNGFPAGEAVLFGGVPFSTPAKLKKNNTKLIQKGSLIIGQTPAALLQELQSGASVTILFFDTKGNGIRYVYTK